MKYWGGLSPSLIWRKRGGRVSKYQTKRVSAHNGKRGRWAVGVMGGSAAPKDLHLEVSAELGYEGGKWSAGNEGNRTGCQGKTRLP